MGMEQPLPENKLLLALSQGDPSGVGPELTLKAWAKTHADPEAPPFFVVGSPDHLRGVAQSLGLDISIKAVSGAEAHAVFRQALPVLALPHPVTGKPGQPDVRDAALTIAAIEAGVRLIREGIACALVTNPIAKEVLQRASFPHPGHTDFLAELATRLFGVNARAVMLIWSPEFSVIPATIHIPLAHVPSSLTRQLLLETGIIAARDLERRFGIEKPRLAFTGLNPHAGEGGTMGREEIEIIMPALADLSAAGISVSGPHAADTLFRAGVRKTYDVVIGMYHDQVLTPAKTVAFEEAVNVTLGLPFIRTSPDHGTAFDIAGKGVADPTSLISALRLASRLAHHAERQPTST